jgi:alpha-amylase/alpha-mannosidase (GH57 family)
VEFDYDQLARGCERFGGHGPAIAQVYNHIIMPLANERDQRTQVRWGIADFRHRFGREPEGMWLAETAVDTASLEALAAEGIRFSILSPLQARRVRPIGGSSWSAIARGRIDPSRAYRCPLPSGRSIALFFYDAPVSSGIAFDGLLKSGARLTGRLLDAFDDARIGPQMVHVATDGETYGHHTEHGERALSHAAAILEAHPEIRLTNYGEFLALHPPEHEVAIVEDSAWSCAHGLGRWCDDCGCRFGEGTSQAWRRPLRVALDWLRDELNAIFEDRGRRLLSDPWTARDGYIEVLLGRADADEFIRRHAGHTIGTTEVEGALNLLEMQRHALLMYTSCGWFFDDIAGLEAVQVLRYAARCMDLLREAGDEPPEDAFLDVLDTAVSNDPDEGTGRQVWARHVVPARVTPGRVVAHIALLELLDGLAPQSVTAGYDVAVSDHLFSDRGSLGLASGAVVLVHRRTGATQRYVFAALHLGALEVVGACRPAGDGKTDAARLAELRAAFAKGTRLTRLLRLITDGFGPDEFDISAALPDAPDRLLHTAARTLARSTSVCQCCNVLTRPPAVFGSSPRRLL